MRFLLVACALAFAPVAQAQDMSSFKTGPVFETFGPHVPVEETMERPAETVYKVAFDVSDPAPEGKRNSGIEAAARFINMLAASGVEQADIKVAVVIHGKASLDVVSDEAWKAHGKEGTNPTAAMAREMLDKGVRIILCGQSAAAFGVTNDQLVPGVEMALSAIVAHALLQQEGYTLNPF